MKGSGNDILKVILFIAGIIAGTSLIEKLARRESPCPQCGRPVRDYAPLCGSCGVHLTWVRRTRQNAF